MSRRSRDRERKKRRKALAAAEASAKAQTALLAREAAAKAQNEAITAALSPTAPGTDRERLAAVNNAIAAIRANPSNFSTSDRRRGELKIQHKTTINALERQARAINNSISRERKKKQAAPTAAAPTAVFQRDAPKVSFDELKAKQQAEAEASRGDLDKAQTQKEAAKAASKAKIAAERERIASLKAASATEAEEAKALGVSLEAFRKFNEAVDKAKESPQNTFFVITDPVTGKKRVSGEPFTIPQRTVPEGAQAPPGSITIGDDGVTPQVSTTQPDEVIAVVTPPVEEVFVNPNLLSVPGGSEVGLDADPDEGITRDTQGNELIKLNSGEFVTADDFNKLPIEDKQLLIQGIDVLNDDIAQRTPPGLVKVGDGEFVTQQTFDSLDAKQRAQIKRDGVTKFNLVQQLGFQAEIDKDVASGDLPPVIADTAQPEKERVLNPDEKLAIAEEEFARQRFLENLQKGDIEQPEGKFNFTTTLSTKTSTPASITPRVDNATISLLRQSVFNSLKRNPELDNNDLRDFLAVTGWEDVIDTEIERAQAKVDKQGSDVVRDVPIQDTIQELDIFGLPTGQTRTTDTVFLSQAEADLKTAQAAKETRLNQFVAEEGPRAAAFGLVSVAQAPTGATIQLLKNAGKKGSKAFKTQFRTVVSGLKNKRLEVALNDLLASGPTVPKVKVITKKPPRVIDPKTGKPSPLSRPLSKPAAPARTKPSRLPGQPSIETSRLPPKKTPVKQPARIAKAKPRLTKQQQKVRAAKAAKAAKPVPGAGQAAARARRIAAAKAAATKKRLGIAESGISLEESALAIKLAEDAALGQKVRPKGARVSIEQEGDVGFGSVGPATATTPTPGRASEFAGASDTEADELDREFVEADRVLEASEQEIRESSREPAIAEAQEELAKEQEKFARTIAEAQDELAGATQDEFAEPVPGATRTPAPTPSTPVDPGAGTVIVPEETRQPVPDTPVFPQPATPTQPVVTTVPVTPTQPVTPTDPVTPTEPVTPPTVPPPTVPPVPPPVAPPFDPFRPPPKPPGRPPTRARAPRLPEFGKSEFGEPETRRKGLKAITWRQGVVWIRIAPPFREADISFHRDRPDGIVARGPRDAWNKIFQQGGSPAMDTFDEFAAWTSADESVVRSR